MLSPEVDTYPHGADPEVRTSVRVAAAAAGTRWPHPQYTNSEGKCEQGANMPQSTVDEIKLQLVRDHTTHDRGGAVHMMLPRVLCFRSTKSFGGLQHDQHATFMCLLVTAESVLQVGVGEADKSNEVSLTVAANGL
jgi:hypothetical protein